jgi:hypothetical protein
MSRHKGKAIAGSQQYGTAGDNNTPQIAIDFELGENKKTVTCFLFFSPAAYPYSIDRLRACGWEGDNLADLKGIDKLVVDLEVTEETYQGKTRTKVEIMTGPGKVKLDKPISPDDFAKRVAVLMGQKAPETAGKVPF